MPAKPAGPMRLIQIGCARAVKHQPRPEPIKRDARWLIGGAIGLARHYAKIERCGEDVKEFRLAICNACPDYDRERRRCRLCGCSMNAKAGDARAQCPKGRWGPVTP